MDIVEMKGRDLAAERHRANVRQYEVAEKLGLPAPVLSRIENQLLPVDAEFSARYMDAILEILAERAEASG